MTSNVPWEAGGASVEEIAGGYNWEAALSARGRASAWTPWWMSTLPPPPVEPIMLTGGIPDPASLPIDDLIACNETVLRREGTFALQYGGPQGYEGLREWLAEEINLDDNVNTGSVVPGTYTLIDWTGFSAPNVDINDFVLAGALPTGLSPSTHLEIQGTTLVLVAVPEPATFVMPLVAALGMLWLRRRSARVAV